MYPISTVAETAYSEGLCSPHPEIQNLMVVLQDSGMTSGNSCSS